MTQPRTLARPYARAVFDLACEQHQLAYWAEVLQILTEITSKIALLYQDPRQSKSVLIEDIFEIVNAAGYGQIAVKNFLLLLNQYHRLLLLPEIADLFNAAKIEREKQLPLTVTSAFPIPEALKKRLQQALEKRLGRQLTMHYESEPSLLGGMIIRADDLVIDSSVKSQLMKLKQTVIHE